MEKAAWWSGGKGEADPGKCCLGLAAGRRGLCQLLSSCGLHPGGISASPTDGPDTTSLTGYPHSSAPRPSGCRQACASASAGSGTPCRGGSCCRGRGATSSPGDKAARRTKPQQHTPLEAGGELAQPSIRPRGRWMWPQFWGLRRFNARPCQMVQDQRRFNLLPPSQLPHPSLSPAPTGAWVLSYSCPTKVERRKTVSPRKTRPVTAVAAGRGSSAPRSCNTTPTSTSSTSSPAHQPPHKIWRGTWPAESQRC